MVLEVVPKSNHTAMIHEQAFVNQFWGLHDGGFPVAQTRIKSSLATLEELLRYYKDRIAIEKEYTKKLEKLNTSTVLGSGETGSLKIALEKLQIESQAMVACNNKFTRNVTLQNYEKLYNFYQIYVKNVSKLETHMQKVLNRKRDLFTHLQVAKKKYRSDCSQIKSLMLRCQATWGKELEKNTSKLNKLNQGIDQSKYQYQAAIKSYADIHEIWVRDWSIALLNLYQLEIERIQMCKLNCFSYCNNIASLCVDLDHSADLARGSFAKVAAPKDIYDFAGAYGTGNRIPSPPAFIDFMNGFDEESPEDSSYTVADFKDPDYSQILTRTFSVQSEMSQATNLFRQSPPRLNISPQPDTTHISGHHVQLSGGPKQIRTPLNKTLPPIKEPLISRLPPKFNLTQEISPGKQATGGTMQHNTQLDHNTRISPQNKKVAELGQNLDKNLLPLHKMPSRNSAYTSGAEDRADVFDERNKLQDSNGLLDYSNPTNYTSNTGNTGRSWSSPRRKERLVHEVQDQINRRLRDMTDIFNGFSASQGPPIQKNHVPIAKDFSIDFMAKALEDLNAGGDGDVTQFRKSVREASRMPTSDSTLVHKLPPSDFINDKNEIATRQDTISFRSPHKPRPKSMVESVLNYQEENLTGTIVRNDLPNERRLLLQSPTKSYTNLNSFVEKITPVTRNKYETKAVAKYTYNARETGELTFRKGWHMYVIHKQEDNWYVCELGENCGSRRGNVGLVPYNYVMEGDRVF